MRRILVRLNFCRTWLKKLDGLKIYRFAASFKNKFFLGMPCAAQYKLDKKWYRAEVLDLPGEAKVYIRYVDYGNREKLSYKHIRRLPMDFFKLAPQVLRTICLQRSNLDPVPR